VLSKPFREFSGFFWNLFSFSLSYFYLLEGSKILFQELQIFDLDCSCPEVSLGIFLKFSIFGALKQLLDLSGIVCALKINFGKIKKTNSIMSIWAEPEGSTHLALRPSQGPP
jgi:hypothetical protein